ncbi:DinB family protein [Spirosoma sp. KUDC1026]|uniref:DinB family protein n=1 Tax=Spirosoma sp. KUDC1026 TaxID=2745947 RepID=UPI00159B9819|nr:DinB family protein [Spirosoma sp. KUDC1026]QKZ14210.1 DinB family protein [Spirosoma sp. KUDC1026]
MDTLFSVADATAALRQQLVALLTGSNAHQSFDDAIKNLPVDLRGVKPEKLPYSIWQLVDHIRIAQEDILEFSRDSNYVSPPWPDGYWPKETTPPDATAWDTAVAKIRADRDAFVALLNDPEQDLYKPFAHGDGQNLLREALLIADHTAYHVGEIIIIRRLLDAWPA